MCVRKSLDVLYFLTLVAIALCAPFQSPRDFISVEVLQSSFPKNLSEDLELWNGPMGQLELMEDCRMNEQCNWGQASRICFDGKCVCSSNNVMIYEGTMFHCYKMAAINEKCNFHQQCAASNFRSTCIFGRCKCSDPTSSGSSCLVHHVSVKATSLSAIITIIMGSIIAFIMISFLTCALWFRCCHKKQYVLPERNQPIQTYPEEEINIPSPHQHACDACDYHVEKPPSYEDINDYHNYTLDMAVRPPSYNNVIYFGQAAVPSDEISAQTNLDFPTR